MIFNESESGAEHLRWEIATADVFKRRKKTNTSRCYSCLILCLYQQLNYHETSCLSFLQGKFNLDFSLNMCNKWHKTKKGPQVKGIYRFYLLIKNRLFLFKKLKKNELWPPFEAFEIETFGFFFVKKQELVYQINCAHRTNGNDVIFWICRSFNLLL